MFTDGSEWQPGTGGMVCESCGDEPASVHIVRIEGGGAVSHSHLCPSCAQEVTEQTEGAALVFALPSALGALFQMNEGDDDPATRFGRPSLICGVCGTSLTDLSQSGLLGCAACYEVFSDYLNGQRTSDTPAQGHLGKVPSRSPVGEADQREVLRLRRMLTELVESERFEEAASVRDRLAELDSGRTSGV